MEELAEEEVEEVEVMREVGQEQQVGLRDREAEVYLECHQCHQVWVYRQVWEAFRE